MGKKKRNVTISEQIKGVCTLLESAKRDYEWHSEKVKEMDYLTQDYLHKLELDGLLYAERAKVATLLSQCRQDRRQHKDIVMGLEPLVQYLNGDKGKTLINGLKDVLGKTRKAEERLGNRVYIPRVLGKEEH